MALKQSQTVESKTRVNLHLQSVPSQINTVSYFFSDVVSSDLQGASKIVSCNWNKNKKSINNIIAF